MRRLLLATTALVASCALSLAQVSPPMVRSVGASDILPLFPDANVSARTQYVSPLVLGAGLIANGGVASNSQTPSGGLTPSLLSIILGRIVSLDDGTVHDGSDDSAAVQTIINNVAATGGGTVLVGPHQYRLNESVTIPSNVKVYCPKSLSSFPLPNTSYGQMPFTFIMGPGTSIAVGSNVGSGAGLFGCNEVNYAVASAIPSGGSIRSNINYQNAFNGEGITVTNFYDAELEDDLIVGFDVGIDSENGPRGRWEHINIDANTCAITNNSHDISHYHDIHCFPFVNGENGTTNVATGAITAVANNGAGLWRVATPLASQIIAGDTVYINGVNGAGSVNNTYVVAVSNGSTLIDLANSNAVGTSGTGTTTAQAYCLKQFNSVIGIGVGDSISGTGVPGGSVVTDVLFRQNVVCMNNQATATGTVTITTTPQAYSSGGAIYLDSTKRPGPGFTWTNGEANTCADCFSYNHEIGINIGAAAFWTELTDINVDGYFNEGDRNSIGLQITGASKGSSIKGGSTNSVWAAVVGTSTNTTDAHKITGMTLNGEGRTLEMASGRYLVGLNSSGFGGVNSFVGDAIGALGYGLNDFETSWEFTSVAGFSAVNPIGNTFAASSTYQGNFSLLGPVTLAGGPTNCNQFSNCSLTVNGSTIDGASNSSGYVAAVLPASYDAWLFTGSGTVSSYTTQLPPSATGYRYTIAYQQAITSASFTSPGGTVNIPYSSITAGQIISCSAWGTVWYCK